VERRVPRNPNVEVEKRKRAREMSVVRCQGREVPESKEVGEKKRERERERGGTSRVLVSLRHVSGWLLSSFPRFQVEESRRA